MLDGQKFMKESQRESFVEQTNIWKDESWLGEASMNYSNGDTYVGKIKNGKYHGVGKYTYQNGSYYEGQWKNGLEHGQGIFEVPGVMKYDGNWDEGEMCGQGTFIKHGKVFKGTFTNP